jgi:hypothetical protein
MKSLIQKISLAGTCAALCTLGAHAQAVIDSSQTIGTDLSGVTLQPNLIIIGTTVISPANQTAGNASAGAFPSANQPTRGLGMGQQGTGTAIGQQGTTLLGPPPVLPPPSTVPPGSAPVLTPPAPVLNTPTPVLTPQAIQPSITPQSIAPSIGLPEQTPVLPPQGRGLGIGQQGTGTGIGQQGTTIIGPQGNVVVPSQQGTTVMPQQTSPTTTDQQGNPTSAEPQANFSGVNLQTMAVIGPAGSFTTSAQRFAIVPFSSGTILGPQSTVSGAAPGTGSAGSLMTAARPLGSRGRSAMATAGRR